MLNTRSTICPYTRPESVLEHLYPAGAVCPTLAPRVYWNTFTPLPAGIASPYRSVHSAPTSWTLEIDHALKKCLRNELYGVLQYKAGRVVATTTLETEL